MSPPLKLDPFRLFRFLATLGSYFGNKAVYWNRFTDGIKSIGSDLSAPAAPEQKLGRRTQCAIHS